MDQIGLTQQLNILTVMATSWSSPHLRLFCNNVTVQPSDTVSTYVEPVASFYTPGGNAISYGVPFVDATGAANMTAPLQQFNNGNNTSALTIYGAFVTSPSSTLVSSYNFSPPIMMAKSSDAVLAGSQIQLPANPQTPWVN